MRTRVFMLALMLGCANVTGRAVQAQGAELRLPRVRYDAPAGCPDRDFFVERMRERLVADRVRALTSLLLRVRIEAAGNVVRGSVQIDRGGTSARRSLDGHTCREVVEGLALIAALAVAAPPREITPPERRDVEARPRAAAPEPAEHGPPEHERAPEPPLTAARPAAAPVEPAPRSETAAQEAAAAARPRADAPARPEAAAREDDREAGAEREEPEPEAASAIELAWELGAAVLALHGMAPRLQPGLQLQAALRIRGGALDWTLRLGGRIALEHQLRSAGGSADFGFTGGVVQLCAGSTLGFSRLTLDGCAVAEPGILRAAGDQKRKARTYDRRWLGLGGGATLGWQAAPWVAVRAGAELLAPVRRDWMLLGGEEVHRVPPVCLRLQLGLEVPLG